MAAEYQYVPNTATADPAQLSSDTGFLKNATLVTMMATRFIVFPTLNVTGEMPWYRTI